jgi:hypothetical protein
MSCEYPNAYWVKGYWKRVEVGNDEETPGKVDGVLSTLDFKDQSAEERHTATLQRACSALEDIAPKLRALPVSDGELPTSSPNP